MSDQEALEAEEQVSEHAAEEDPQADKASAADEDLEVVELELSDDDIVRYLEDEQGRRIGFVIMEDGEEAEYLYVEDDEDEQDESEDGQTEADSLDMDVGGENSETQPEETDE